MNSNWYTKEAKLKFKKELELALQNEVGCQANDFIYVTPDGKQYKMYDVNINHTLLFFYNPECPACKDIKAELMASPIIKHKLKIRELALLSMYIDKDLKVWKDHLTELPKTWIAGRDQDEHIYKNGIYDVRAIPSLYLLDKDKTVLLKDATKIEDIETQLIQK
jgi:thioredoxin-related protein